MTVQFAWHVHHDTLLEPLSASIETRIEYIRKYKPLEEQALRLRLLHVVKGPLPRSLVKPLATYGEAWEVFVKARETSMPAILTLHAQECPGCPWDGQTIFPNKKEV